MKKGSLKGQFILTFVMIITASLISTALTYYIGYYSFQIIENKRLYRADYFERKIPTIEAKIREQGGWIFNHESNHSLQKVIPQEGIGYQVMDQQGVIIYGTDMKKRINHQQELFEKINTTTAIDGEYMRIVPVFDTQGKLIGAVSLTYQVVPHFFNTSDKIWIIPLFTVIALSPFIFIIIFTIRYSRKFAKDIGKPIQDLIEAAKKVKEKNLDFEIKYEANNELGRLCQAFNEMKNKLKESLISQWKVEQERYELIDILAHDLKTPFTVIHGYVDALLEEQQVGQEKWEKYLKVIKENADRGSTLTKDMLQVTELESNRTKLNISLIDIKSFLLKKKEDYQLIVHPRKIKFKINVNHEKQAPPKIALDEGKLNRILDNIIMNSIRYTSDNGTITINAFIYNDRIRIQVCDSGKGFSEKDLAHLFDKFYRGDPARSSSNIHTGLGLYIVKKLVDMHGGNVKAYNQKGVGACIEFLLCSTVRPNT